MLFKYWDDQCVVYNTLSADTHLLYSSTARLLELIIALENDVSLLNAIRMDKSLEHYHALSDQELLDIITSQKTYFSNLQLID